MKAWSDELGAYGEEKGNQVLGVEAPGSDVFVETRTHTWELRSTAGRP